jgi:hypothetical protein
VPGDCIPEISFSSYDLVTGKIGLGSGNASIDYRLIKKCTDVSKLQVIFNQNLTMNAPNITYHALVSKSGDEETVYVELSYRN